MLNALLTMLLTWLIMFHHGDSCFNMVNSFCIWYHTVDTYDTVALFDIISVYNYISHVNTVIDEMMKYNFYNL